MISSATVADRNTASAEAYYKAMKDHDLNDMSKYLSQDIYLVTPMEEINGKQRVLEAAEKLLPHVMSLEIKSSFASGEQVVLIYDLDFSPALGVCRTAALLTFKDGLIIRNELFFDATAVRAIPRRRKHLALDEVVQPETAIESLPF